MLSISDWNREWSTGQLNRTLLEFDKYNVKSSLNLPENDATECCFYWQQSVGLDGASLIFCHDPLKVVDHNDWWLHCTLPMSHTYTQTNQGNQEAALCSSFHYEEHRVWHWSIPHPKETSNPHGFLTTLKIEWILHLQNELFAGTLLCITHSILF